MQITFYSLTDYNNGRLIAKTFDLEEYPDYPSLSAARTEWLEDLTKSMADGQLREEFIVADYEGIPSELVGEWDINTDFNEYIEAVQEHGREVVVAALACGIPLEDISDCYRGHWDTHAEMAEEFYQETQDIPDNLLPYIDWDRVAHDLLIELSEHNGHYFWNH